MTRSISLAAATALCLVSTATAQQTAPIQQLPTPEASAETKALGPAKASRNRPPLPTSSKSCPRNSL
ncbi:MAG: hypothetical protein U5N27_02840 [Rhizobium sp.]|nr:hypothetical protein [Rhizobium sp.]